MENHDSSKRQAKQEDQQGGIDRRGFLKCMAWAGTGLVWTVGAGGLISSRMLTSAADARSGDGFSFVQLSDSHIGFSKEGVNSDVTHTLESAIAQINALPQPPALVLHTGDLTHLAKPEQFDTVQQVMNTIKTQQILYVPGEHDVIGDQGAAYRKRFHPRGSHFYYSTDYRGVHFIALSNIGAEDVFGVLGNAQIEWLQSDLKRVHRDTPIVVFAHVPLYAVYPEWGWFTKDSAQAMALLKPFSSVTVLNGHIHQVMQQTEGQIRFHVAGSTAFPQHHPGVEKPGPFPVPADELLRSLGFAAATVVPRQGPIAVVERTLA